MAAPVPWRLPGHTADLRVEVSAPDFPALCATCALALATLVADRRLVRAAEERFLPVPPGAPADSLPPFLRAVLLLLSAERFLVRSATPLPPSPGEGAGGWRISLRGEPAEPGRHRFLREVKAVTRHAFEVERVAGGEWRARFVLDV